MPTKEARAKAAETGHCTICVHREALPGRKTCAECKWSAAKDKRTDIRHWRIIEGSYEDAPDVLATWFVDPPYNNKAGSYYVENNIDYESLGAWCRGRSGQRIVCENEGASWLPFRTFATLKAGVNGKGSKEVIWP